MTTQSPTLPWILPDDEPPSDTETIAVDGHAIAIPVYGSLTINELQYLEYVQKIHGSLTNVGISQEPDVVYHLLMLRFQMAQWSSLKLVPVKKSVPLPTIEDTLFWGMPKRLKPLALIQQIYAFFLDEFQASLGKPKSVLETMRRGLKTTGQPSTGDSSQNTQEEISEVPDLDSAPSTSSDLRLMPQSAAA